MVTETVCRRWFARAPQVSDWRHRPARIRAAYCRRWSEVCRSQIGRACILEPLADATVQRQFKVTIASWTAINYYALQNRIEMSTLLRTASLEISPMLGERPFFVA